ncbi:hypothetical protein PI124_g16427 [Phytophthora idaei]|nr:hypothetical protein PI125_g16751 [Phytophthora idaei]KAG3141177.1 hypothetical protein PI126_g15621 [Phytophthora idaei]KAG3238621.1 hypothetical protein PI124_g16427 [Phytophthora idaei]
MVLLSLLLLSRRLLLHRGVRCLQTAAEAAVDVSYTRGLFLFEN